MPGSFLPKYKLIWLLVVFAILQTWPAYTCTLTPDEFQTRQSIAGDSLDLVVERGRAGHLPTYFGALKMWSLVSGDSAFSLRLFSLFCASTSLVALYMLVEYFFDSNQALCSAAVLAFNPAFFEFAHTARMYCLVLFMALLSTLILVRTSCRPAMAMAGYLTTTLLCVTSHLTAATIVPIHFLYCFYRFPEARYQLYALAGALVIGLAALSYGLGLEDTLASKRAVGSSVAPATLIASLAIDPYTTSSNPQRFLVVVPLLVSVASLYWIKSNGGLFFLFLFVPFVVAISLSCFGFEKIWHHPRYSCLTLVGYCTIVGIALWDCINSKVFTMRIALTCVCICVSSFGFFLNYVREPPFGARSLRAWLSKQGEPGKLIIMSNHYNARPIAEACRDLVDVTTTVSGKTECDTKLWIFSDARREQGLSEFITQFPESWKLRVEKKLSNGTIFSFSERTSSCAIKL